MLLIVSKDSYKGRFIERARDLIAAGSKVGYIYVNGTNYVHCPVCPALFAPPVQLCECCRDVSVLPKAEYRYELGTVPNARPIYFCRMHVATFERFAGSIHEENYSDSWGECPGCKTQCIFEGEVR